MRSAVLLTLLVSLSASLCLADPPAPRPIGDSHVISSVPSPGFPEGIAVYEGRMYVSGPAQFGIQESSKVWVFDIASGNLVDTIEIQNQPASFKAASCIIVDDDGMLYVAVPPIGVVKINPHTHAQTVYGHGFTPFFNAQGVNLLNDLAFDKKGNLYVTDSQQATIWRIPHGGGVAHAWFTSPVLASPFFGPNGIRIDEKGEWLYFTHTLDFAGNGTIYKIAVKDHPTAADLKTFYVYKASQYPQSQTLPFGAAPDGIAFGKSGNLYVALAGTSSISVISPAGVEIANYAGPAKDPKNNNQPVAYANPSSIAFRNGTKSLLVTNHALLVPGAKFMVFDVYVNDKAGKTFGDFE